MFHCSFRSSIFLCLLLSVCQLDRAVALDKNLIGDWSFTTQTQEAGWISISEEGGEPVVSAMFGTGSLKPKSDVKEEGDWLTFPLRSKRAGKGGPVISKESVKLRFLKGALIGLHLVEEEHQRSESSFYAKRLPPMPSKPDLEKVRFGEPINLFNGKNLDGWKVRRVYRKMGWSAKGGELVNETPKTDFSAYGDYANLMTEQEFGDFHLHIEFNVGEQRNSGVYLRGMYEAQVVDRDSRMQGGAGVGAIFGRIKPTHNAGKPGGEWNTYDLTLVDRHVTVVLNGEKVIDNQPVEGPTGGALYSDVTRKGPIYLQGDHTSVRYRSIVLRPVVGRE